MLELGDDFGREEILLVLDLTIVAVADTVLDAQALTGIEVVERLVKDHAQRARHHAIPGIVGDVNKLDVFGRKNGVMQVFDLVVYQHTHGITLQAQTVLNSVIQVDECFTAIYAQILVGILAEHLEFVILSHKSQRLWVYELQK